MITFDNFIKWLTFELAPLSDEKSYRSFFKVISNGKEFIVLDDLYRFAEDLDLTLSNEEIEQFFFSFSLSQGSKIEFDVFCNFLRYSQKLSQRKSNGLQN